MQLTIEHVKAVTIEAPYPLVTFVPIHIYPGYLSLSPAGPVLARIGGAGLKQYWRMDRTNMFTAANMWQHKYCKNYERQM